MRILVSAGAYALAMAGIILGLSWGQPSNVVGMFLVSGLAVGSLYALGGIGLVVLYRATGVLNFANGAIGALGVMVAWQLVQWGWPGPLTWVLGIGLTTALSLGYGRLIGPGLAWRDPVVKAVATLGFALVVLGMTAFAWEDDVRRFALPTDNVAITILGLRVTVTRLVVVAAVIGIVVVIWAYLGRTRTGLQMRALANDRDLSALIGVPIVRVETVAWGISGVIAGFTGLMFGNLVRLEPTIITFMIIPSIAAAICGRLDNLALVLVGGLSMGVIESMLTLSPELRAVRPIAPFVIAALVLVWIQMGHRSVIGRDQQ
ncbi:MAG: branched-chain amino acid ABC transporter permease [Pararhodobacter sp.]|nr:branched-chain amino acid ABC transporter permease [Pararhodobacter sp.]